MSDQNQSQGQTKKCPKCGEEVQSSAKICKHCQTDLRSFFAKHKIITGFLIFIVIIIFSSVISSYNKTQDTMNEGKKTAEENEKQLDKYQAVVDTSNKKDEKPAEPAKLIPQVTVTSVNISKEYSENEVAADAKYKGKIIEISGKVSSIDNGTFDNEIIIRLSDGKYDFNNAWCYMKESEREKAIALKKGQQVTLIGTGDSATMSSPVLKDCVVK